MFGRGLFLFILLLTSTGIFAQSSEDNMIQIGSGAMQTDQTMEALIEVKTNFVIDQSRNSYFVLVRMNADGSISKNEFKYIDLEMRALGFGGQASDELGIFKAYLEGTLLNFHYQRNVSIDLDKMYTLNLLGVRVGGEVKFTENIKLMGEAAVDFAGVALSSQRSSDLARMTSTGLHSNSSFHAELSLLLYNRFKITAGVMGTNISANGYEYKTGREICETVEDGYGWTDDDGDYHWIKTGQHQECHDEVLTNYQEHWSTKSTYFGFMAQITKRLSVFGKAQYAIFKMDDETGVMSNSSKNQWQFMFGAVYKF